MQIEREDKATRLLSDLFALVRGECPRLLSEDSGMDAALCLDIEEHLRSAARSQPGAACPSDCAENGPLRSDGWRDIASVAPPHNRTVLLGWQDWRDGRWISEVAAYSTGERLDNGFSNRSFHGSATHWMPLPPPRSEGAEIDLPHFDGERDTTRLPAHDLTADEITREIGRVSELWDEMSGDDEFGGHGGSPGEWMVERLDELETEQKRRLSAPPPSDHVGGEGKYRCTRCGRDEIDGRENGCARGSCPMEFVG